MIAREQIMNLAASHSSPLPFESLAWTLMVKQALSLLNGIFMI